jgi:ribonuclease BN (tRNA processing enzyme)
VIISIIGTGDAYALHRANSAILVEEQQFKLLIDCGPTVCQQLWKTANWQHINALYFTHLHPDHTLGLTSLINRFNSSGRRRPLQIFCHKGKEARLQQLVEFGFWSDSENYSVEFVIIDEEDLSQPFQIGPFSCLSEQTHHGVINHSLWLDDGQKRLFYSGDGCITDQSAKLIANSDLAFIECQAMSLAQGAGHSDFAKVLELAKVMPEILFQLYHISDADFLPITDAVKNLQQISIAEQGTEIELN